MLTTSLTGFLNRHHVHMTPTPVERNPHMSDMPRGSTHWRCVLRRGRARMTTYFSMGPALTGEPTTAHVLDSLASDSATVESAKSFEAWAEELGYDADSRAAEATYQTCVRQAHALKTLLGEAAYRELLYDVERL